MGWQHLHIIIYFNTYLCGAVATDLQIFCGSFFIDVKDTVIAEVQKVYDLKNLNFKSLSEMHLERLEFYLVYSSICLTYRWLVKYERLVYLSHRLFLLSKEFDCGNDAWNYVHASYNSPREGRGKGA